MAITLYHYVVLATLLFAVGLYGLIHKRNIIAILMSIELMLNAANLNLVAFNRFLPSQMVSGQMFAAFSIMVGVAEVAVGLSLAFRVFRDHGTISLDALHRMKG